MRGVYCGHVLDTEIDNAIVMAEHDDGTETLYVTPDGAHYYFVIDGAIGFAEPDGMRRWVMDHSGEPQKTMARVGAALPACRKGIDDAPARPAALAPGTPGKVWYLLPVLLGIIGGIIMYAALYKRDMTMARNGLILGFVMLLLGILVGAAAQP